MYSKLFALLVVAVAVFHLGTTKSIQGDEDYNPCGINGVPFEYDCSQRYDGNYPHPTKCTHYVACTARTVACEMACATNHTGTPLHYVQDSGPNPATSRCDYPEVAKCVREPCKADL